MLTFLNILHQDSYEVFSRIDSVDLGCSLERLRGCVVQYLNLHERFGICDKLFCYFLKHEYAIQVDEIPLEYGPLIDELHHKFNDFLDFEQLLVKVSDVRICFQNAHSQEEFFKHVDELR